MRISKTAAYALSTLAAAALLAACSGLGGSSSSSGSAPSGVTPPAGSHVPFMANHKGGLPGNTAVHSFAVHPDHSKSWISPDVARAPRLLFVSDDGTNDVLIFTMPAMALKGTLTGFSEPQGMCSDASGNIWITNTSTSQVFQYSRTGQLLKTLSDADYFPVGCAVNRSNGDLAVTNIVNVSDEPGNVMIYKGGTGSGSPLTNSNQYEYFFPTYDASGNLWVDGFSNSFEYILSVCPASGDSCNTASLSGGTLYFPGGLNWDRVGGNLILGDQECQEEAASCQYTATTSGSSATITGSTDLKNYDGTNCDVDQGTLAPFSKYFAGPCITEGTSVSTANRWPFPGGGSSTSHSTSVSEPIGSAISNQ
jgi:hypothetical protein